MKRMILGLMLVVLTNLEAGDSNNPCKVGPKLENPPLNLDRIQLASLQKRGTTTASFDTDFPRERTTTPSLSSPVTPSSALTGPQEQESDKN